MTVAWLLAAPSSAQEPPSEPAPEAPPPEEELEELDVFAEEVVGGVAASLALRRDAATVTEVVGAEQMTKSGDPTATAALARVPGLTIVDGRFVYVRGLGDRYSSTLLDGSALPSPEPERRVVPLDLFPTGLLASVTLHKTWTPDLPGEFGGGVVALETRGIPERRFDQLTLTGGYASGTTLARARQQVGYPGDALGFGLGPRGLPDPLVRATRDAPLVEGDLFSDGFTPEELERIGESVDARRWGTHARTLPPDAGLQWALGRRFELGGPVLGVYAGLTYQDAWTLGDSRQRYFDLGSGGALSLQNDYRFDELRNDVTLGALGELGLLASEQHRVVSTTLVSRSASATTRTYRGFNGDLGSELRATRLQWVERQLVFEQVRGEHTLVPVGHLKVTWRYAFAGATRDEPDTRDTRYDLEESTGAWLLSDRPEGNGIFTSALADRSHDARLDLALPFGPEVRRGAVTVGGRLVDRRREVDTRRFSYFERRPLGADLRALAPDRLFTAPNIGPDGFELREVTRETDNYTAGQVIRAGYALVNLPFATLAPGAWGLSDLSLLAGARVEQSAQTVRTFALFDPSATPVVADLATTDVLPSATLTQAFTRPPRDPDDDTVLVRLGYARTVSRPDFRELSPASFNDVTGGREIVGNPGLERAILDHADLRWEWYPASGESVSLGGFAKWFRDPIETTILPSAQLSTTWDNATAATNVGAELDLRKTLRGLGPPALGHVYLAGNAAWIRSRVDLGDAEGVQSSEERALQGQSPWVLNGQLGYDDGDSGTTATISLNAVGPRIVEVGALGAPDVIEAPGPRLDVLLQQRLAPDWTIRLRGRNLLDPMQRVTQGDRTVRAGRDGWQALASLEWRP